MLNLGEWIDKRALFHPNRLFVEQHGWCCDNAEFRRRVHQAIGRLENLSIEPGDRVATVMENGSAFLELLFACAAIGAVLVPFNHHLPAAEMLPVLKDRSPRMVFYAKRFAHLITVIRNSSYLWIEHEAGPLAAATALPVSPKRQDPVRCRETGMDPTFRSLVVTPLFPIGALCASALPVIYAGGSLVFQDFTNPSEVIERIRHDRINYMFAVPAIFRMMARSPAWLRADFSHVHFFIAGENIYAAQVERSLERLPQVAIKVISEKMGSRARHCTDIGTRTVGAVMLAVMSVGLWFGGVNAGRFGEASLELGIPFSPFYRILSFGMSLYGLVLTIESLLLLTGRDSRIDRTGQ